MKTTIFCHFLDKNANNVEKTHLSERALHVLGQKIPRSALCVHPNRLEGRETARTIVELVLQE